MIVADTGAIIALIDRKDRYHQQIRTLFDEEGSEWILPWAILPEVDYLLGAHVSAVAQTAFLEDLADGAFAVEWGNEEDLDAAQRFILKYKDLRLGLVDAVVMAIATRLRASAIVTLNVRHFGAVRIPGNPQLWPRDGRKG